MTWALWLGAMMLFGLVMFVFGYFAAEIDEHADECERARRAAVRRDNDAAWEGVQAKARKRGRKARR